MAPESGEGWQREHPPTPGGVVHATGGGRPGLLVELPVVSRRATLWLYGVLAAWLLATAVGTGVAAAVALPPLVVVSAVAALLGALAAHAWLRTRRRVAHERYGVWLWPHGLGLATPDGVLDLAWEDVRAVRQRWTRQPTGQTFGPIVVDWVVLETDRWPGAQRAGVVGAPLALDLLPVDPWRLVALLRHYLARPGDRPELADGRALQRFGPRGGPPGGPAPARAAGPRHP